ncbi:hypothetical protein [Pseudarthrobacter enclensis]|uniref:hypothetical protein n=1 Tax=Pseudarthrobacter enclensis TaxID=993070 RepID=UPI0011479C7C|nr:hypothetical protein [Pseudarthrobacter enclensis]
MNDELDTNEDGFSRRRVVKGVAWTLPVLVTAVGAPPASASPGPSVTLEFDASVARTKSITQSGNNGQGNARNGVIPAKLIVNNASGSISGSIIITATDSTPAKSWIGPKSLGANGSASLGPTTTWGPLRTSTRTFTLTGGTSAEYPITFQYNDEGTQQAGVFSYLVTVQVGTTALASASLQMTIA